MPGGGYRYYRDASLGAEYAAAMDFLFDSYSEALPRVSAWVDASYPVTDGEPEAARRRAVKAKALDLLRGLLPAASLSHMGIYASGQAYEQLIMHLLAHPLPEARTCGRQLLEAVKSVMPSLRLARGARGPRRRLDRLPGRAPRRRAAVGRAARPGPRRAARGALVASGWSTWTATSTSCSPRCCSRPPACPRSARSPPWTRCRTRTARRCSPTSSASARTAATVRAAASRPLRYRFEIVSDYGAFRDLQRHRMLTVQWQGLTPDLGAEVPEEVVAAGCGELYERALDRSRVEYERLRDAGLVDAAPYALCLGYRIRYVLDMNAREAMHLTELRSAREGHASYRAVAQAMHDAIADVHPADRRDLQARGPLHRAPPRAHPGRDPRRVPRPAHRMTGGDDDGDRRPRARDLAPPHRRALAPSRHPAS